MTLGYLRGRWLFGEITSVLKRKNFTCHCFPTQKDNLQLILTQALFSTVSHTLLLSFHKWTILPDYSNIFSLWVTWHTSPSNFSIFPGSPAWGKWHVIPTWSFGAKQTLRSSSRMRTKQPSAVFAATWQRMRSNPNADTSLTVNVSSSISRRRPKNRYILSLVDYVPYVWLKTACVSCMPYPTHDRLGSASPWTRRKHS